MFLFPRSGSKLPTSGTWMDSRPSSEIGVTSRQSARRQTLVLRRRVQMSGRMSGRGGGEKRSGALGRAGALGACRKHGATTRSATSGSALRRRGFGGGPSHASRSSGRPEGMVSGAVIFDSLIWRSGSGNV